MQRSQHVDDRGPVGVVDRVLETARRGVDVRKQRQGMPAVQRADDLTSPRRHWSDDELEPGFRSEPRRCLHGRRQVGHPRRGQIAEGHEPSRARLVDREPVVPAEPDGQVAQLLHRERPLAGQCGGDIAVAYIRRAPVHRPRLGRRVGRQQQDIAAHSA
jgi:hypothetical protein